VLTVEANILQVRCPSYDLTNSVNTLKKD